MKILIDYKDDNRILSENEIKCMYDTMYANVTDREKSMRLYSVCNLYELNWNIEFYKASEKEYQVLLSLRQLYLTYDKKGFRDKSINKYGSHSLMEAQEIYDKLIEINKIYNSDKSDIQKALDMVELFKSASEFRTACNFFLNNKLNKDIVKGLLPVLRKKNEIEGFYKDFKNNFDSKDIEYFNRIEAPIACYDYAKFIANLFVKIRYTIDEEEFFDKMGINEKIFNVCLTILNELDVDLYNLVLKTKEDNKRKRKEEYKKIFIKLANFISKFEVDRELQNGLLVSEFNILTVLKMLPFKYNRFFISKISKFLDENLPDIKDTILNFFYNNGITELACEEKDFINEILNTCEIVDGYELTRNDKIVILDYLKSNDIPILPISYQIVRKMYLSEANSVKLNAKPEIKYNGRLLIPHICKK